MTTEKQKTQLLTANHAAAHAAFLSGVQVISAYPITPQSPVVEKLLEFIQTGKMKSEFTTVESEHSAITVCISASTVGARVFTSSCANGLALMHEQLHWAAGSRLPIVMAIPNRAVAAPWSILNDQQDSISQRDTGWMQIYCRNSQEVLDSVIQAYKIAERVYLPAMVCYDGYVLSHTMMPVSLPDKREVADFLPDYIPHTVLDSNNPKNINPVTLADPRQNADGVLSHGYMELRYLMQEAHLKAVETTQEIGREFKEKFGRSYGILDEYKTEDAELIMMTLGSLASEAEVAIDLLRKEGYKVGLIHVRLYRPFPAEIIADTIRRIGCKGIAVIEKNISYGYEGALAGDVKSALYSHRGNAFVHSYIAGLGGRNVSYKDIADTLKESYEFLEKENSIKKTKWIGLEL